MKEYYNSIPDDFLEKVVMDLANIMNLIVDFNEIQEAAKNDGEPGEHCVRIFKKENSFLLVDVQNNDFLKSIVVRCEDDDSQRIWDAITKWDILAREKYNQSGESNIRDSYGVDNNMLSVILNLHGISIV